MSAGNRLNPELLSILRQRTGLSEKTIRNNISKIRQNNVGLTMNAAAQVFARQKETSFVPKLSAQDKTSLATYQAGSTINVVNNNNPKISKHIDNRAYNITESTIENLALGDGSTVNQQIEVLGAELRTLLDMVGQADALSDEQKNDYTYDIQTIATQLNKSSPDKSIIKSAWKSISALSTIEGFTQFIQRMALLLAGFLS